MVMANFTATDMRPLIKSGLSGLGSLLSGLMPKCLYARALIIIIAPIVLLEGVVAFTFMERHWQAVTRRLSEATVRDIAAVIELYRDYNHDDEYGRLIELARDKLRLSLQVLPAGDLPQEQQRPFFSILDRELSKEINRQIQYPFWLDTLGNSSLVEVRVKLDKNVLKSLVPFSRGDTYQDEKIEQATDALTFAAGAAGFAFVDVRPRHVCVLGGRAVVAVRDLRRRRCARVVGEWASG